MLNGLAKLRNLKNYNTREDLFKNLTENASTKEDHSLTIEEGDKLTPAPTDQFESRAIQHYKCDPKWPICLYDFTFRNLYPSFFCFKAAPKAEAPTIFENHFD